MAVATRARLAAAGLAFALLGVRLLTKILGCAKDAYSGLESIVSFSSRLIAASRALETREGELALVQDPLAEQLAGTQALAQSSRRSAAAPEGSGRRHKVGMMGIRTRWFDDQILAGLGVAPNMDVPQALRDPSLPAGDPASYVWQPQQAEGDAAPPPARQVVVLGAGMDSRPWRMQLPMGVRWFEVDRPDVLRVKRSMLQAAGAELPDPGPAAQQRQQQPPSSEALRYPLRCASWAAVTADLASPAWVEGLLAAGLVPAVPTVWVAEGLLMYLELEVVANVLSLAAGISAPGSTLVSMSVTEAVISDLQAGKTTSELMRTWVFGCPEDPTQFLRSQGWALCRLTTRAGMAASLALSPELCTFPVAVGGDGVGSPRSLFFAAAAIPSAAAA